ncbi:MAG: TonB-dependent receptor plug domain-containing protein, partial [Alphaproteobacteria bacterium]|nr:TonB-dependent receptor plug domain-containing protein [Alphaproteobacteria bacterium]
MKTAKIVLSTIKLLGASLILGAPATVMAAGLDKNTIVVTGARVPVPISQIGGAFTLISQEDLRANQSPLPVDIFRQVPGLAVSQSGGIGQLSQVRMRGAEGTHTLVLIDGVEANDPIFNGEFDFGFLTSTGIERIEVLRGAQSALYGSDSIGGVINIITRSGSDGFSAYGRMEGGSFGTVNTQAGLSGGTELYSATFDAGYFRTDGINISRFGDEKDGSENVSFNFKGRAEPAQNLRLDAMLRYTDGKTEFDNQDFAFPPTPTNGLVIDSDSEERAEQLFAHLGARLGLFDDVWVQRASVGFTDTKRQTLEEGDRIALREGERLKLTYQSTLNLRTPELGADHIFTA